jgi:hypothetical protein
MRADGRGLGCAGWACVGCLATPSWRSALPGCDGLLPKLVSGEIRVGDAERVIGRFV